MSTLLRNRKPIAVMFFAVYGRRSNLFILSYLFRQHRWKTSHGSLSNLTNRSEVVSIFKYSKNFRAPPQIRAAKTSNFWPLFSDFLTRHVSISSIYSIYTWVYRISSERNSASTNHNTSVNLQYVPLKLTYFPCDFWPRNGWGPFRHCDPPYENSAFSVIAGLPTQRPLNPDQPNFAGC